MTNAAIFRQTDPLTIAGFLTASSVSFAYQLGTSAASNPYIYLDFYGSGPVSYNYNFVFDVEHVGPQEVYAGQQVTLTPYLDSLVGAPSLTASQQISFGTNLNFGFELGLFGIDVEESLPLPNTFVFDDFFAVLGGTTNLTTSGVNIVTAPSAGCPGCFVAETNQSSADAWRAGIDLLGVAANQALALEAVDALFDLNLTLGMPIYRRDLFGLYDYRFSLASAEVCAGVAAGSWCDYEIPVTFEYSLFASSIFAYGTTLSLDLLGPFGIDENIFELSGEPFGIGRSNTFFGSQSASFTLRGRSLVEAVPDGCRIDNNGLLVCLSGGVQLRISDLDLAAFTSPALAGPQVPADFGGNGKDVFITVPEPNTAALLLAAVLMLGLQRRRAGRRLISR